MGKCINTLSCDHCLGEKSSLLQIEHQCCLTMEDDNKAMFIFKTILFTILGTIVTTSPLLILLFISKLHGILILLIIDQGNISIATCINIIIINSIHTFNQQQSIALRVHWASWSDVIQRSSVQLSYNWPLHYCLHLVPSYPFPGRTSSFCWVAAYSFYFLCMQSS